MQNEYKFTLRGSWRRLKKEFNYYTKRPWSLEDVGNFWSSIREYDSVNETIYPYVRRFTNSYNLAVKYLPRNDYEMLDVQTRTGKGSLFWHEKGKLKSSVGVDFSDFFLTTAAERLADSELEFKTLKIRDFPLPFKDDKFDLICSYETIEHVYEYRTFFSELMRVLKKDGILILTCPNRMWEWVHWLLAIININHSEGPHRFLKRKELLGCIRDYNAKVLEENSTIILPFNNKLTIKIDKFLERILPKPLKSLIALRRTFILTPTTN